MSDNTASSDRRLSIQRLRPHVLALITYTAMTVTALNNLVLHLATAIPGTGEWWDYAIFYWNLWWVKYALFDLHRDPMFSNYVLYPYNVNLSLHTFAFAVGLFSAPFQRVLDLKLIYNGAIVVSFIASGYFTFLFLRRHVRHDWLAGLGGALFTFSPATIYRASFGHVNLVQAWWLPLQLLLWDGVVSQRALRSRVMAAAGLGLTLYLAWMTDVQFMLWIAPLLAPYVLYTWIVRRRGRERLRVASLAVVAGAFMLGPALIEPIPAILQARGMAFPRADLATAQFYSYQLRWLVINDPDHLGASIGLLVPLLSLVGLLLRGRRRERWLWFALGVGALVLSLGPYLEGTRIPLPYILVHQWLDGQYRTPGRFTTPAALALTVFVTLSLANLFERKIAPRWQPWLVSAAMVALIFDSGMLAPFPITFIPDYRIYHEIGRDPAEYALLEVPVGPASGFEEFGHAQDLQYYSYIHHKQIINGTVSRIPSGWLDKYRRSPVLSGLTGLYDLPPLDVAGRELADKLDRWDMRYVLVHRDRLQPERARAIIEFLNIQPELCLVDEEGNLLAYRRIATWADCPRPEVSGLLPSTSRLVLGDPGNARYIGPGWYDPENIGGPQGRWAGETPTSTLHILLPRQNIRVSFRALPYPANQTVTISVNGQPVAVVNLVNAWAEYEFTVPADLLPTDGPSLVTLVHARLESPLEHTAGASSDKRLLAAAYDYFSFEFPP